MPDPTAENPTSAFTPAAVIPALCLALCLALVAGLAALLPRPALAEAGGAEDLIGRPWAEIEARARGGEVNFFMWGGSDSINAYVSDYIGGLMKARYDITLNRVPLTETADAVAIVLAEKQAGNVADGSVDLIWINGVNFRTMRQGGLVWCGYTGMLPNAALVDWQSPAVSHDFGVPVEGCEVPWSAAQMAFAHDSARVPDPPRSIPALIDWVKAHPGRFTYPAPPDFNGAAFVRLVFYHAAGGVEGLLGPFDQATFDRVAPRAWAILNEMEPDLWRGGETYPTSIAQLQQLFANGEVDLSFEYNPSQFGVGVENGTFPASVRSYGLSDGTLANMSFTAIPFNARNKAAAMVLQNLLLSGEAQLQKARPEVWGAAPGIDMDRADPAVRAAFAALPQHPSVVPAAELARAALPELQPEWIAAIEKGWIENVGRR